MTGRTLTLVDIVNNPTSVPPLHLAIQQTSVIKRGVAVTGLKLVATGGSGGGYLYTTSGLAGTGLADLSSSSSGSITGTPTNAGVISFTATVVDSGSNSYGPVNFTITVKPRFSISKTPTHTTELSAVYNSGFAVSGNTGAVTFSGPSSGHGLTLHSDGSVDGTSTSTGTYTITTTATDAGTGDSIAINYPIVIRPHVSIFPPGSVTVPITVPFSLQYTVQNAYFSPLSLTVLGKPSWLSLTLVQPQLDGKGNILVDAYILATGTPPATYTARSTVENWTVSLHDNLGITVNTGGSITVTNFAAIQYQLDAVNVGSPTVLDANFSGTGVADVQVGASLVAVILDPYSVTSGTNTYTATTGDSLSAYAPAKYLVKIVNANTGASTLSLDGLGPIAIQLNGAALTGGEMPANSIIEVLYMVTGPTFQIIGGGRGSGGVTGDGYTLVLRPTSATIASWTRNRYTANNVHLTTPAAPGDGDGFWLHMSGGYTGCTLVANTGQTIETGIGTLNIDQNMWAHFTYDLATTNWECDSIKTGSITP